MNKVIIALLVTVLLSASAVAQKQKPWVEWSKKDAEKILNDSPWGQTQTETDTSQMFFSPTSDPGTRGSTSNDSSRLREGATNTEVHVNFRIRFFSAKPVRQAFARLIMINQPSLPKETAAKLAMWSDVHSDDWVIVAVAFDSTDQRYGNRAMQAFAAATTDLAKNDTYLERKDGKKVFLTEYQPPGNDGAGAKFVFARSLDGQPFLTSDGGEVRFHSQFSAGSAGIKLDRRFKVADMMYDGKLEY